MAKGPRKGRGGRYGNGIVHDQAGRERGNGAAKKEGQSDGSPAASSKQNAVLAVEGPRKGGSGWARQRGRTRPGRGSAATGPGKERVWGGATTGSYTIRQGGNVATVPREDSQGECAAIGQHTTRRGGNPAKGPRK